MVILRLFMSKILLIGLITCEIRWDGCYEKSYNVYKHVFAQTIVKIINWNTAKL